MKIEVQHGLIVGVELAHVDSGNDLIVRLKNGKVVQISPDFDAINVWQTEADMKAGKYCMDDWIVKTLDVDLGGGMEQAMQDMVKI